VTRLAVYVHWPFCRKKCPYCDFNSHVADDIDHARWRQAYRQELSYWADRLEDGGAKKTVSSIFFGGGTPSLMEPQTAAVVIDAVADRWGLDDGVEITLEANPTSVEAARLSDFKSVGINRLSLGVQGLDDGALTFLGRQHDVMETRAAIDVAANCFDRWSMDLIYARPGQTVAAWMAELDDALEYGPDHMSAYQLTIEKGTPFYADHRAGLFRLPGDDLNDDLGAELYEQTGARLAEAGLQRYEISNYAGPGAQSRHNLSYWRAQDYVGIGPGAHGRLAMGDHVYATRQIAAPDGWLSAVASAGHGTQDDRPLDRADLCIEAAMMGLRLAEGIELAAFKVRTGIGFADAFGAGPISALKDEGLIVERSGRVHATDQGLARLNALLGFLTADISGSP
jgi:oxygen-independent coproporphyrinogen-3 oxidase